MKDVVTNRMQQDIIRLILDRANSIKNLREQMFSQRMEIDKLVMFGHKWNVSAWDSDDPLEKASTKLEIPELESVNEFIDVLIDRLEELTREEDER